MVKIKEGYQFSPKEQAEYDRVDALPRKASGRVDYFFKPEKKYPARIYVYMHGEIWQPRNRRPMGLHTAFPFLSRPMNAGEIEYHHFDTRLCYHQYEDWDKLLYAEEKEAEELDRENPGTGTAFFEQLKGYRGQLAIGKSTIIQITPVAEPPESEESRYFRELTGMSESLTTREILELLELEQQGEKRMSILFLLREYLKNKQLDEADMVWPDEESINRKVALSQERSRKNFVRRIYHKNKLFALDEIRLRYPHYTNDMLLADLKVKSRKAKKKKHKPITDLRRCQLEKLAVRLRVGALDEKEYHQTCCRMVMLQNAHDHRLPIPLTVKINGEVLVYSFNWKTREDIVKSFVNLANTKGMTHETLKKRYNEILQSPNSF